MTSAQIEKRVAALEEEMARLKSQVGKTDASKPWWERIAGSFDGDPLYEKAMKLGGSTGGRSGRAPASESRDGDAGPQHRPYERA